MIRTYPVNFSSLGVQYFARDASSRYNKIFCSSCFALFKILVNVIKVYVSDRIPYY